MRFLPAEQQRVGWWWDWLGSSLVVELGIVALHTVVQTVAAVTAGTRFKAHGKAHGKAQRTTRRQFCLVVLAHPRSGSTKLLADLHNTGRLWVEGEILNPLVGAYGDFSTTFYRVPVWRKQLHVRACVAWGQICNHMHNMWCAIKLRLPWLKSGPQASTAAAAERVGVVFKVFPSQLGHLDLSLAQVLQCVPGLCGVVVLYRGSLLKTFASLQAALATDTWVQAAPPAHQQQHQHKTRPLARPVYVRKEDCLSFCSWLVSNLDACLCSLSQFQQTQQHLRCLVLRYEDTIGFSLLDDEFQQEQAMEQEQQPCPGTQAQHPQQHAFLAPGRNYLQRLLFWLANCTAEDCDNPAAPVAKLPDDLPFMTALQSKRMQVSVYPASYTIVPETQELTAYKLDVIQVDGTSSHGDTKPSLRASFALSPAR